MTEEKKQESEQSEQTAAEVPAKVVSEPFLNKIIGDIDRFRDEHIVHIPEEHKQKAVEALSALIALAVEAGAKGAAEGLAGKVSGQAHA